jgi:hypothetical protein
VRTKKLRNVKIQLLPLLDSGEHVWPDPNKIAGSGGLLQIRLDSADPGHFGQIRPDKLPDPSTSSRIPAILARSGLISGQFVFQKLKKLLRSNRK